MGLDLERIEALCFDVDGTLMDTDDQIVQMVADWLTLFRGFLSQSQREKLARRIIMALESPSNRGLQFLDWIGLDGLYAVVNNRLHQWGWRRLPDEFPLIPGTLRMLEKLKPHYPMAIVSARGALQVDAFVAHHSLGHLFETVVSGQTRPRSKPHPDPILWAAQEMNVLPAACLMIGDTTVDIHAGRAAGAQTVAVLSGFGEMSELQKAGADLILSSVAEIPSQILDQNLIGPDDLPG